MSHFKEYQSDANSSDGRNLGDEWMDWDGKDNAHIKDGKGMFISLSLLVLAMSAGASAAFIYLISPRLAMWHAHLPVLAWMIAALLAVAAVLWFVQMLVTAFARKSPVIHPARVRFLFDLVFSGAFRTGRMLGVSRDRIGRSFVRVSNEISRATKPSGREEKLLVLLPRCLAKDELKQINDLKDRYPISIHTVSGGELARKKVKELKPTAVIGVACERDLVSGIRDVGSRFSVIGIPNERPHGPCKDTRIDMQELIDAIEFFVGPPSTQMKSTVQ